MKTKQNTTYGVRQILCFFIGHDVDLAKVMMNEIKKSAMNNKQFAFEDIYCKRCDK